MLLSRMKQVANTKEITIHPSILPGTTSAMDELKEFAISVAKESTNNLKMLDNENDLQVIFTFNDKNSKTNLIEGDQCIMLALKHFVTIGSFIVSADVYTTKKQPGKKTIFLPIKDRFSHRPDPGQSYTQVHYSPNYGGRKLYSLDSISGESDTVNQLFTIPVTAYNELQHTKMSTVLKKFGLLQEYQFVTKVYLNIGERNEHDRRLPNHIQVNIRNLHGGTPLHRACYFGCHEYVKELLLKKNVDINAKDSLNETPMHKVSHLDFGDHAPYDYKDIVSDLIKNPFLKMNAQNSNGETIIDKLENTIVEIQNCNFGYREDIEYTILPKQIRIQEWQEIINTLHGHNVKNRTSQFLFLRNNLSDWGKTGSDIR
jgi:hypothetical protein